MPVLTACSVQAVAPEVVKPDNQLQLTETELKEDIAKMLTTGIPDAPKAAVRYLYREHAWRPEQVNIADSVMMHYSCDGWLLHQTLDEARRHERTRTQQAASAAAAVAAYSAANRGVEVQPPSPWLLLPSILHGHALQECVAGILLIPYVPHCSDDGACLLSNAPLKALGMLHTEWLQQVKAKQVLFAYTG